MGWRIVRQPNGRLGLFSEIVDDFTHMNMTEVEAVQVCMDKGMAEKDARDKVTRGVEDHELDRDGRGDGLYRWRDALRVIANVHQEPSRLAERRRVGESAPGGIEKP